MRQWAGGALLGPNSAFFFFFPPGFNSLWAKKETKAEPTLSICSFPLQAAWKSCPLCSAGGGGRKGWPGSPRVTSLDWRHQSPVYIAEALAMLEGRAETTAHTPPHHSFFPAGFSAALSQQRVERSVALLSHLAPSVSFLLPFPKTLFSKHSEIKHQRGIQEQIQLSLKCCLLETFGNSRKASGAAFSSTFGRYWRK